MAYQDISYPLTVDFFREVADGSGPSNIIAAELVNKIHNALAAVQYQTQYTLETPYATGSVMFVAQRRHQIKDHNSPNFPIKLTIDATKAAQYFGGSPFNRRYCLFPFATGYRIVGGVRRYFPVRTGVNTGTENSNLTCQFNVRRTDGNNWDTGHYVEIALVIVDPGVQ